MAAGVLLEMEVFDWQSARRRVEQKGWPARRLRRGYRQCTDTVISDEIMITEDGRNNRSLYVSACGTTPPRMTARNAAEFNQGRLRMKEEFRVVSQINWRIFYVKLEF